MNIHEYQSKAILRGYGVNVPDGGAAFTPDEAVKQAQTIGADVVVVKAQIHAGGRGKAGGVKLAHNLNEVRQYAEELLGKTLVTHQTGPAGKVVRRLLIEAGSNIKKEYYTYLTISSKDIDKIKEELKLKVVNEYKNEIKFINNLDSNIIIKKLSKYNIDKLLIEEISLEDLFINYYK